MLPALNNRINFKSPDKSYLNNLSIGNSIPTQEQIDDLTQLATNIKLNNPTFYNLVVSKDLTKLSGGAIFRMIEIAIEYEEKPYKLAYLNKYLTRLPDKPNFDKSVLVTKDIYTNKEAILDSFKAINYNERIIGGR